MVDIHVRDLLRFMETGQALRALAQLERMAAPDPDELEATSWEDVPELVETTLVTEDIVSRLMTPTPSPPPRSSPDLLRPDSSSSLATTTAVTDDLLLESQDPRSPQNTFRESQLTSGDFAWMMGERPGELTGQEECSS